jgi:hypothetical protein
VDDTVTISWQKGIVEQADVLSADLLYAAECVINAVEGGYANCVNCGRKITPRTGIGAIQIKPNPSMSMSDSPCIMVLCERCDNRRKQ